jgi:hypothetical protein
MPGRARHRTVIMIVVRRRLEGVGGVAVRVVLVPVLFVPGQRDIGRGFEKLFPELRAC